MADPFSIIAGTAGLIDVCWRFGSYLNNVRAGAAQVEDEIGSLSRQLEALTVVNKTIQASYNEFHGPVSHDQESSKQIETLWRNIKSNLQDCQLIVVELEHLVTSIIGKEHSKDDSRIVRKLDGFRKQLRKQSKEGEYNKLQARLQTYYSMLQLSLDLIASARARQFHNVTKDSIDQLHQFTGKSFNEINEAIAALQATLSAPNVESSRSGDIHTNLVSQNEYFSVPQGVEKFYTGRATVLEEVQHAFSAPPSPGQNHLQRRVVIYGIGGSGKTQFCCKYAQLYRESYWGIFWINASSNELAKQTFRDIARFADVAENVRAVKNWLSNLKTKWLLIVDNADSRDVKLNEYFPEGERGHILITTRIPSYTEYGTVTLDSSGAQSLHFQGLKDEEANVLLLRTASLPVPGDTVSQRLAASITEALGYLPLALVHAGKAIVKRLCTLDKYLQYHQIEKQKVRQARGFKGSQERDSTYMDVWSTFEINFGGLQSRGTTESQDAVQLLQMFSFFHRENIRIEFLSQAVINPKIEQEFHAAEAKKEKLNEIQDQKESWTACFKDLLLQAGMFLYKERSPPVLPTFLRDAKGFEQDGQFRLRAALSELTQLSLITYNDVNESYSMHPVVHTWARERPEFSTIEQAVWCQAAITTLGQCILLPPLASTEADERLRHELLPHIDHVRERQREIREKINENQSSRWTQWFLTQPTMTRSQIGQYARFSRVYGQEGRWNEAKELQLAVKDFCLKMLGPSHVSTNLIKLALSGTYWQLGQGNLGAELQEQVLETYTASYTARGHKTLKVMDVLGESRWQQGRFTDSFILHERAYNGMVATLGPDHEDTLKAADNLGRAHAAQWRLREARKLLYKAVTGMKRNSKLGPAHLDTLMAMNNLAMTYLDSEGGNDSSIADLEQAHDLVAEVLRVRQQKLGKEHPYTLWAVANFARVKSALGMQDEAEADLLAGLAIADRNLGSQHIGTLFGKLHLGNILIKQERYDEAAEMLEQLAEDYRHSAVAKDGEYPDRSRALDYLSTCYRIQGKWTEAIEACEGAIRGMTVLGGQAHPFMTQLQDKLAELLAHKATGLIDPTPPPPYETRPLEEDPPGISQGDGPERSTLGKGKAMN